MKARFFNAFVVLAGFVEFIALTIMSFLGPAPLPQAESEARLKEKQNKKG